ncbi:MAG: MerR family transcriptional regulator [Anaerovoracaceae bacterium]
MKKYFTTGEFATLCKVTKQTLFHYDRIGILCPKIIGENGYRYYSYHQLDDFALIYSLRDLGMPLKGIKEYLDRRSPEELTRLLEEQKKAVEEKVAKLRWMGEYLEFKLKITTDAKAVEIGTVKEEEQA